MKQYILLLAFCINPDFSSAEETQNPLEPRVIGGRNATKNEFPFVVSLLYHGDPQCTGTIINRFKVLTAAHCISGTTYDKWTVKAGFYIKGDPNTIERKVKSLKVHRIYVAKRYLAFDIAIMDVTQPFEFNAAVQPVIFPEFHQKLRVGTHATLVGWGVTQFRPKTVRSLVLKALEVVTISKRQCKQRWKNLHRRICAVGSTTLKSSCFGDSGGPLMVGNVQWGLISGGTTNCTAYKPLKFLEVSMFTKWIKHFSRIPRQKN
ncbi:chymotrypsin-1-like isoform X2 [Periplaneta americana]|uniref:chymotrypsin-1-like isoform X2 n=1 Tax=Periplaneta americana TaxID=6978 RepID=UPI0037E88873